MHVNDLVYTYSHTIAWYRLLTVVLWSASIPQRL